MKLRKAFATQFVKDKEILNQYILQALCKNLLLIVYFF